MNKYVSVLFLALCCLPCAPTFARPEVTVIPVNTRVDFETSESVTDCGPQAAGCTVPVSCVPSIRIDCEAGHIVLDFSKFEFLVQIINQYKKGTPEFDHILKHELTHVALRKGVTEKFYQPIASAVLLRFEKSLAEKKHCFQVQSDVYDVFYDYVSRMIEEADKQDNLIDGEENYAYQWKQVAQNRLKNHAAPKRSAPKEKAAAKAKVSLTMLETKRNYNITAPENIAVDRSGRPSADGQGILKNLVTGASLEVDRAAAFVDCQTGRIRLELGYSATITFNEKRGTFLYDYLMDSLSRRIAVLERHGKNAAPKIKEDAAKVYERLAARNVACEDIRARLNKRMIAYRQKVSEEISRQNSALGDAVPLWRQYFEKDAKAYADARRFSVRPQKEKSDVSQRISLNENALSVLKNPPERKRPQTAESEKIKQPSVPQNKIETAENHSVPTDKKIVMGAQDRYYISMIRFFFIRIAEEFKLKEKFDNLLKNIKNRYNQLFSENNGSMPADTKADENSK